MKMVKSIYCHPLVVKLKNNIKCYLGKYFPGNWKKMLKSIYCHETVVKILSLKQDENGKIHILSFC